MAIATTENPQPSGKPVTDMTGGPVAPLTLNRLAMHVMAPVQARTSSGGNPSFTAMAKTGVRGNVLKAFDKSRK